MWASADPGHTGGFPRGCREQVALSLQKRSLPRLTSLGSEQALQPAAGVRPRLSPGPGPPCRLPLRPGARGPPGAPRSHCSSPTSGPAPPARCPAPAVASPAAWAFPPQLPSDLGESLPPSARCHSSRADCGARGREGAARVRCASGIAARSAPQAFPQPPGAWRRGGRAPASKPRVRSPGSYRRGQGTWPRRGPWAHAGGWRSRCPQPA